MGNDLLARLFEHNNWANRLIIEACATLSAEQLDAQSTDHTKGTVRQTLWHIMEAQHNYASQIARQDPQTQQPRAESFSDLLEAIDLSGQQLLHIVRDNPAEQLTTPIEFDGHLIQPWVILVQAINHATEHREQIKSMLSALGVTPPRIDGWQYGRVMETLHLLL